MEGRYICNSVASIVDLARCGLPVMRPSVEKSRLHRRRQTAPPAELSKERLETEVASIESGLKLLDVYTAALKELKERGQDAAGDIKLALDVRHAPRDWSNVEILSVMSQVIDEHPRPRLEFVLGVLGVSKVPASLDERLRSQGAKAYAVGVRTKALRKKKEARERQERLERERREKKEREERERREEQERKERKEREERERLEREKKEKERIEEQKRKAAQRKESEAKRARGKSRRGRRGRAPTRITAAERAKKIEMDNEADDVKEPAVGTDEELEKGDAMEVGTLGAKSNSEDNKSSKTSLKMEAEKPAANTRRTGRNQSTKVERDTTTAPLGTSRKSRGTHGATTSVARPSQETANKSGPLPLNEGTSKAITAGSAKRKTDMVTLSEAVKSGQHTATVTNADDKEGKSTNISTKLDSKKESQEPTKPPDASDPQSATPDAKEVATTPVKDSSAKDQSSKKANPRIIEESKIASALKESAAAVNGEVRDVHDGAAIAKDIAADVGTGAVDLSGVSEKKDVEVKESVKEESLFEAQPEKARNAKGVSMVDVIATGETQTAVTNLFTSGTAEEPTELKEKVEGVKKSKATEPPPRAEDKVEISKGDVVEKVDGFKKKTPANATRPDTKGDTKSEKDAKEGGKGSDIKSGQDDGNEGGEDEKEDFMADVFGSDEEGDKEDTEEASEKRVRRYRTRGRQSDVSDSSDDAATTKRESDEEAAKGRQKRGRPSGARRVSRRMSNMRDEIVVAPSGRRMRRESRNLMKRTWELPEPDQYLLECVEVWERIHANKISIPFREPVTVKDAPGYFDVVKQPMDLKTVQDMLQDGRIASPVEFYENMRLIVRNAFLFNDRESDLYELAMELRDLIRKGTKPIVKSWKEARGLDSEESESESEIESARKRGRGRPKKKVKVVKSKKKRKRGKEEDVVKNKKRRVLRRSSRTGGEDGE